MPSTTLMSLQAFLQTPHARMPNFQLTRQQIDGTGFKSLLKGDEMQRRLVEPLYSTNAPLRRVNPTLPPTVNPRRNEL